MIGDVFEVDISRCGSMAESKDDAARNHAKQNAQVTQLDVTAS